MKELIEKGIIQTESKEYKAALSTFNAAIKKYPNSSEAYGRRAIVKEGLQDYNSAKMDFDKAILLDSNNLFALFNRGCVRDQLGDKNGAIEDFSIIITLNSSEEYIFISYIARGGVFLELDKSLNACEDFKKAKDLGDDRWYNLHCQ